MDSLTQAALGATVGHTLLGKHIGRAAPIWGAALGTLPDLDVFISFGGAVEDFTYHRSFSHSLIVLLAITPLLTWLIFKFRAQGNATQKQWFIAIIAILWTHVLLDALTVYGTQLLWPLTEYPFGVSSVFIIDPLYTIPLLLGLTLAYKRRWHTDSARKATVSALAISSLYLAWGLSAKHIAEEKVAQAWASQEQHNQGIVSTLSTPLPFNSFLWRIIINEKDQYHIAHIAVWEDPSTVEFKSYPKGESLLDGLGTQWDVQRLAWFTKGFYRAQQRDEQVVISDLRMGVEGSYAFNFAVAQLSDTQEMIPIKAQRIDDEIDLNKLSLLWSRIWDSSVSLHSSLQPSIPPSQSPTLQPQMAQTHEQEIELAQRPNHQRKLLTKNTY